jgi:Family of unknown function (DUF6152)
MKQLVKTALVTTALALSVPALAHHSGAMFDASKTVTINGTVREFNWTNPHSSFKVEVSGSDGKAVIWAIEMNSPQNLIPLGWKRNTIKAGDKVSVVIHPLRDGQPGGQYMSITLADGRVMDGNGPSSYGPAPSR